MSSIVIEKPSITTQLDWIIDVDGAAKPLRYLTAAELHTLVADLNTAGKILLAESYAGLELALSLHRGSQPQPYEVGDLDADEFDLMFWGADDAALNV